MTAVDCAFCAEFAALPGPGQETRIICEASGWVLLPTVGCLTPGYCLFMPLDHIDAAADAAPPELTRVGATAEEMRALISGVFGPVIIAEHGPRGGDHPFSENQASTVTMLRAAASQRAA